MEIIKKSEGISPYVIECGPNGRCDSQCSCRTACVNKCKGQQCGVQVCVGPLGRVS